MKTNRLFIQMKSGWFAIIVIFVIVLMANVAAAQEATPQKVTGRVTDLDTNDGMPGVSVYIKGTQTGSTTDVNGNYDISVPKGSTLVFTMVGYEKQEILIENQTTINIALKVSVTSLDEVVVIGYGITTKRKLQAPLPP